MFIKIYYNLQICEICGILNLKERTAFRRIEKAFENLADALNKSKYMSKLCRIIDSEDWIREIKEEVRERRMSFKVRSVDC